MKKSEYLAYVRECNTSFDNQFNAIQDEVMDVILTAKDSSIQLSQFAKYSTLQEWVITRYIREFQKDIFDALNIKLEIDLKWPEDSCPSLEFTFVWDSETEET